MTDRLLPPNRRPIVIADSHLRAGERSARVGADDPEVLLRQYLRLIRRVRKQQRHRSVALRRVDISALAAHLGWSNDEVLSRLADLMGATRRQRTAMLAVMATGASLITITSPAAASPGSSGTNPRHEAPVVVLADHLTSGGVPTAANEHAGRLTGAGAGAPAGRQAPVLAAQARRATPPAPSLYVGQSLSGADLPGDRTGSPETPPETATETGTDIETETETEIGTETEIEIGTGPDIETGIETGIDADGNLVATGPPPIPLRDTDPGTDTDPGIEKGIDADGNLVATGQPPVPDTDTDTDAD